MEENYNDLSKGELIEKLKSKDEQIAEMAERIDKTQNMRAEAFMKLKTENEELKKQHEFAIKTLQEQHKAEEEGLKNTIVRMCTASYLSQDTFMTVFKDIDKKLNLIVGGK